MRNAWKYKLYSWTQFRRFVSVKSVATRKLEYQRKLSTAAIQEIQNHFYSDEISFPVPDKKYVGKRFLRTNMKQCLNMYNVLESTTRKISLSTLYRLRPKQVKLQGSIPLRQACCEKCLNFEMVAKEVVKYLEGGSKDIQVSVDSTLCPYSNFFPNVKCVLHICKHCGTDQLKRKPIEMKRFLVKWWVNKNKMKNRVAQSYLNWNVDRYSYLDLIDLYVQHLHSMAEHSFMATWNYCQFKRARTNIKPGELLLVNDFAQNYLCLLQNEPQGMNWEHKQVTLHPTVAYYSCPNEYSYS